MNLAVTKKNMLVNINLCASCFSHSSTFLAMAGNYLLLSYGLPLGILSFREQEHAGKWFISHQTGKTI